MLLSETATDEETAGKPPVLGADASKDVVVLEGDAVVLTDDSAPEPRVMAQIA